MRRVFISHRNGQAGEIAFIRRLRDALQASGFEVLVDFDRLEVGAPLRQDIYTWLGLCHAAIVLLSPQALSQDSAWVPTESAILAWRRTLDPGFLLIPVLMPGVAVDDLREHLRFRDLGLHDLLCLPFDDEAVVLARIAAALQALQPAPRTPVEELAEQIEVRLQGVRDDFLDEALRLCGFTQPITPFALPRPRAAALALLQLPLADSMVALEYLAARLPRADDADAILDLVAPTWVDLCAARWLARCALAAPPRPAVVVNAATQFGAEMLVRRACARPPRTMWQLVKVTAVVGETAFEDLALEIQAALLSSFAGALQYAEAPAQQLAALLQRLYQHGRATIVVLRLQAGYEELVPALQQRFPLLSFLFLSGKELPAAPLPSRLLCPVDPAFAPGQEDEALTAYMTARALLRPHSH